jgi:hypothetical protein
MMLHRPRLRNMRHSIVCSATIFLLAGVGMVHAQTPTAVEAFDQSLFHSEPVEDDISTEKTPAIIPAKPATEKPESSIQYDTAILQGLKKVTAETSSFEAPVDMPTSFGTLTITVKKCVKSKPEEQPENSALILIQDHKPDEAPTTVFSGWMFSSSPAISALEHPVYDITMLDCSSHKKH